MDYFGYGDITCKRLLLAAENDVCSKRLLNYLLMEHYSVVEAVCGEEVISNLSSDVFDVCIIDYGLPGTTFSEIIDHVRSIVCFTPIVLMVSNRKCALEPQVVVASPIYLLIKPFSLGDFGSIVRTVVGKSDIKVLSRPHRKSL